jgi:hypothetical protein
MNDARRYHLLAMAGFARVVCASLLISADL